MTRSAQSTPAPVRPWPWWRRHKAISALLVLAVVAGGLTWWRPWERCGEGMTEAEGQCVGLNLGVTPFADDETMNGLQQRIAEQNAKVTESDFITVVVLNGMTPDSASDSAALLNVHHGIMGAITAQQRVNRDPVVGSTTPRVKLLLANYGGGARQQSEAVAQILAHRDEQRIVAVIGLGQSLVETRAAASALSEAQIAVISAVASADNMNRNPDTEQFIERFYRITSTNTDAANAAVSYLRDRNYQKMMLVRDDSSSDIYTRNLGDAFRQAYQDTFQQVPSEAIFNSPSPSETLTGINRDDYLQSQFHQVYTRMCQERPDLVYFAGRGSDLKSFLRAVGQTGACPGLPKIDVLTSDDASSLLGGPLPAMPGTKADVYYTSVATADMWKHTGHSTNQTNYQTFADAFVAADLGGDLRDGYAMAHHDALLLAVGTARRVPNVGENTVRVADWIDIIYNCANPLRGATGEIAYSPESHGNPIDKALPIMLLKPSGETEQRDIVWTTSGPSGPSCR